MARFLPWSALMVFMACAITSGQRERIPISVALCVGTRGIFVFSQTQSRTAQRSAGDFLLLNADDSSNAVGG
jgi:hypothetical protein